MPAEGAARLVFHVPGQYLGAPRYLALFDRLDRAFRPRGAAIEWRDRRDGPRDDAPGAAAHYDDGDLHILDMGRVRGPGILNAGVAYIAPWWHLDPAGVQGDSGIGALDYDPRAVGYAAARPFFEAMRAEFVTPRRSRRDQTEAVTPFRDGAVAVFLQGRTPARLGQAHCTAVEMLRAVACGAGGREVIAKPHPLAAEADAETIAAVRAEGLAVTATTANVHDILAACACTVSFNSAVAMEGFLHRKPAILFGRSDFHHICETVRDPADFPAALARTLARPPGGYAQYLKWYLGRHCLNLRGPRFVERVQAVFDAAGFPAARLGLSAG